MTLAARIMLLLAAPAAIVWMAGAQAADPIKSGEWEFSTQLQAPSMRELPAGTSLPPGAQPAVSGGGMKVTHTQCVEPDKAVPSDPRRECKVEKMDRKGSVIAWSTSCKGAQGTVESAGTARYSGDTMVANLNVRAPNGRGGVLETAQHITGRYLGPCPAK
jgi:Protein of unknown function (DUF3617)